ncbi:hypothetical protein D9613_008105 [Agrocybe pediades]|uniref:Uncharacterized protein n=1 Tax=Agrocybe pediades TaxID=84607 RepID=A0A8H4VK17_9AGAR|nr:hypothetical protein D9613_008105 [Agrocybe pediades]
MTMASHKLSSVLLGTLVSLFLFGINSAQVYRYIRSYGRDPWQLRYFVGFLALRKAEIHQFRRILQTAHTCMMMAMDYRAFVTYYGDREAALSQINFMLPVGGVISAMITSLVQFYFAFRLYKLSANAFLPITSCTFSSTKTICYLGGAVSRASLHRRTNVWKWAVVVAGVLSVCSDLVVGIGLISSLWKRNATKETFLMRSTYIDKVFIISIRGSDIPHTLPRSDYLVTTITLIVFNVSPSPGWIAMSLIACRLFSISFLSSLLLGKCPAQDGTTPEMALFEGQSVLGPIPLTNEGDRSIPTA